MNTSILTFLCHKCSYFPYHLPLASGRSQINIMYVKLLTLYIEKEYLDWRGINKSTQFTHPPLTNTYLLFNMPSRF